jgi:hypothetical protein
MGTSFLSALDSSPHPEVILGADTTKERRTDMPRVRHRDTPEYAVDVINGAKPIGRELTGAAGLLTLLLVAMSAMEAPFPRQDFHVDRTGEMESPSAHEPGLLCSIGGTILNGIAIQAS